MCDSFNYTPDEYYTCRECGESSHMQEEAHTIHEKVCDKCWHRIYSTPEFP